MIYATFSWQIIFHSHFPVFTKFFVEINRLKAVCHIYQAYFVNGNHYEMKP